MLSPFHLHIHACLDRIRDGLVLEGEIQEMEDEENHNDEGPYKAHVHAFFLAYHQMRAYHCWLSFRLTVLERYCKFEVSLERVMFHADLLISFVLMDNFFFSIGTRIRQA
jgi:hypothetical protein